MADVVLVVDMLKGFLEEGNPLYCGDAEHSSQADNVTRLSNLRNVVCNDERDNSLSIKTFIIATNRYVLTGLDGKLNKLIRIMLSIVVFLTVASYVTACSTGNPATPVPTLTETEARTIADPVAENILLAMNTGNYAAFTRDFDTTLKNNQSEDAFKTVNTKRTDVIGAYISKDFWMMTQKNDKLTVAYIAKFTKEPSNVTLTIIFKYLSGKWQVDGLIYDSPLMRAADC